MANGIVLSILVPTIVGREQQFKRLQDFLSAQLYSEGIWNEVEIAHECDDRVVSIGVKRQLLLNKSYGDFVVMIDDDDWVPDDYCLTLWQAIKDNPDIDSIGFLQRCIFDGTTLKTASLSNKWKDWYDNLGGFDYVRTPFFPTPMRRDIAVKIGYNDLRFGEDHDFAKRLKASGLIKKELFIDKEMYVYQHTTAPFAEKYGGKKLTK